MADWLNEIELISEPEPAERVNSNGFAVDAEETINKVFCNEKSVGYAEFYKSQQLGIQVDLKVEVHIVDYSGERKAKYNGKRYSILKTYKINDDVIELTLSDLRENQ